MSDEERQAMRRRYFERYDVQIEVDPRVEQAEKRASEANRMIRMWEMRFSERAPNIPEEWEHLAARHIKPTTLPWALIESPTTHQNMGSARYNCRCSPPHWAHFKLLGVIRGTHFWLTQCERCTKVRWCRSYGQ